MAFLGKGYARGRAIAASRMDHVVLVPGFFGFESLGDLRYFAGVSELLQARLEARGLEVRIIELKSLPTASIRHRAALVLDALADAVKEGDGMIHLVGHSTGGLDARLAVAPTASLPTHAPRREIFSRVRSIVTMSTPHLGTPLADFFAGTMGRPLLKLAAGIVVFFLERGYLPLSIILKLGEVFRRVDDVAGLKKTTLDQFYDQLLSDFSPERRDAVVEMLNQVVSDQSLVYQLTHSGVDLLNAATADPEGIRYGCVLARSRPPNWRTYRDIGFDGYAHAMHLVFRTLHSLSGRGPKPHFTSKQQSELHRYYDMLPTESDSDGVVPTASQYWGQLVYAAWGDHLDLIGHYGQPSTDWFPSGSGFDRSDFERVWDAVAAFIADEAREHVVGTLAKSS